MAKRYSSEESADRSRFPLETGNGTNVVSVFGVTRSVLVPRLWKDSGEERTPETPRPRALCSWRLLQILQITPETLFWASGQATTAPVSPLPVFAAGTRISPVTCRGFLACDCCGIHAACLNRYSHVCRSHRYQDKSKPAQCG